MSQSEPTTSSDVLHEKYEQITRDGADLADRPKDARAWLIAFANFAPGTQVSLNLITRDSKSLLPVLTSWLWIWAQRTQVARKQARSANAADDREKMMAMQYHGVSHSEDKLTHMQIEEKNLAWLFNYIFDYLGLDHDSIPPSDLGSLCDVLLHICQSTTVIEDIEESINITYGILQKWDLPQDALEPVLDVLCNTRMSLSRSMPSHLIDCIKLLVTGDLSQPTMNYLESSITKISTSETTKKSTALARGSVLFLGDVIKEKNRSGLLVVHFPDLIEPLSAAGGTAAPRLCTDILDFCDHMLLELDIRATILDSFAAFMGIVGDCALIAKAKAAARLSHVSDGEHTIKIDESDLYQHANIVSTTRVKERLVGMWKQGSLDDKQQVLLYEFLIDTPEDTDESTLTFLLHHVEERKLCYPDKPGNKTQIHRLVKHLIQNKDVPSQVRRKAVDVIDEVVAVTTKDNNSPDAMSSSRSSGLAEVIGEWLNQLKSEEDPAVAKHIANSLQRIAIKEHDEKSSLAIIMGLETMVLQKDPAQTRPTTLVAATQTLANIVLQSPRPEPSFRALLKIANIECNSIEARVEGLRFLFRLRCDSDGVVYIQSHADSQYIAAALCRTRESSDSFSITDNVEFERKSASSASLSTKSNTSGAGWMYPDTETYCAAQKFAHEVVTSGQSDADNDDRIVLDMGSWLITMAECLQRDQEWETYSYLIVHAGAQLSNTRLFSGSDKLLETVVKFRQVLCERIVSGKLIKPPIATGLKDSDVAICLFNVLTALNPYATIRAGPIQKGFADELVKAFLTGVGGAWEGTSRGCIHALSICCLEMPASVASSYPAIVDKMSKNMTQSHLSMHILEFLAQVARLPAVHSNFQDDEIMMIFSICVQFLERARERPTAHLISPPSSTRSGTPARQSGLSSRRPPYRAQMLIDLGLSHYNSALVYHVMIFWFLSLRLSVRARSIKWIIPRLVWKDRQGEEQIDEQSMVFIDMMQRTAYSDLGETVPHPEFANPSVDGKISSASWVVAQSIVTIETAGRTGLTQIIKRQASGTTHAVYQQHTAELPSHHVPVDTGIRPEEDDPAGTIEMLPSHVLLQMAATADPVSYRKQPVLLAKDDATRRAIQSLDRLVTIDSHKLGIMYIGPGQTLEKDYLANTSGTPDYHDFLEGMGRCVSLAPPLRFNPQGLQNIIDGTETYAWRDRVTEIVFHVPTMMPNRLEDDPGSTQKKSHVGNCHVNIIYNRSGLVWDFANFSSQLNYVNIVVEPANRPSAADNPAPTIDFYRVQTLTAPHFPQISPCSDPKIISSTNLAQFVRLVALNANVFCQAWNVRDSDTEFPSTWRARLQAIKRLREKVVSKEKGTLAQQLDFSGFTLS